MIDNDARCKLIEQLVAIESVSGNERAASEFLVDQMKQLGYDEAYVDSAGSAVGIREAKNSESDDLRTLILLGHIDTVPGDIPVRVENGILHGRGSVDAKGPLATFVIAGALAVLPANVRLITVGAVEEESATSKGARQIAGDFRADYCVIGEPSSSRAITLGYKGRILIHYQIEVEEGHTAGPDPGAAQLAAEFWNQVLMFCQSFNTEDKKLFDQLLPSLRSINSSSDGLHSTAKAKIGIRLPPEFDIEKFKQLLNEFAHEKGQITTFGYEPAHRSDRKNALVRAFSTSIRQVSGERATYKLKTGTADMNVVAPVWQCPIVAYGPGDSSLDHTPIEHLVLEEFLEAIEVLKKAIESLKY